MLTKDKQTSAKKSHLITCPKCKGDLNKIDNSLICDNCDSGYSISKGIPVLVNLKTLPSHLLEQIEYFEKEKVSNADRYTISSWQKKYLERFVNNFKSVEDKKILDCGTGSGYMAVELAKLGSQVTACDLTLNSLIRLKKVTKNIKSKYKIEFVCCSADELPFKDSSFDYFISNAVLEHLPKEKKAIEEINRVTKTKAGLMLTVPIKFKYIFPLLRPVNWIHDKRIGHLRRYDLKTIAAKFYGWKIIKTYYTGHIPKVMKTLINMIVRAFNEEDIETQDDNGTSNPANSSNIICILKR